MKTSMLKSLRKKYEAEMESAMCNIEVYMESPVGIGEHPDLVESVESQVTRWMEAEEMIAALDKIMEKVG